MVSNKQKAKMNIFTFNNWIEERYASGDWSIYVRGNKLNRSTIAQECCFAKSVLRQNPSIKSSLKKLEEDLKQKGILSNVPPKSSDVALNFMEGAANRRIEKRLHKIEQQNQSLIAENKALKEKLKKCGHLENYLLETGRVPR